MANLENDPVKYRGTSKTGWVEKSGVLLFRSNSETRGFAFIPETLEVAEVPLEVVTDPNPTLPAEYSAWRDQSYANLKNLRSNSASDQKPNVVSSFTVNIAQVCNLACTYCAAGDGSYGSNLKKLELEKALSVLRTLLTSATKEKEFIITFLGGEPLLFPELIETIVRETLLFTAGVGPQIRFDIVTNGTLITPEVAELLGKIKAHVTISLDGPPDLNDQARIQKNGKGSTEQVLKGINNLLPHLTNLSGFQVGAILGRHNTSAMKSYRYLRELPFEQIKFDFAAEAGDEEASNTYVVEMLAVADEAFRLGGETELRRIAYWNTLFQNLDDQYLLKNHCLAGKSHLQMDTAGNLTVCQWFVGDPTESIGQWSSSWSEDVQPKLAIASFAQNLTELHRCDSCWVKYICGGGCMHINKVKTGSKHEKDPSFCARTRRLIAKGVELYAESR